jgi:hypothetical protein
MKKPFKVISISMLAIASVWIVVTFWAESTGAKKSWELGNKASTKKVLIVFDPDPFYNLDEQVCHSFGQALSENGLYVRIATVKAAKEYAHQPFELYVFCANTYNWHPDWAVTDFIKEQVILGGKPVVAITLGSGSTETSQKALEDLIIEMKGNLIDSHSLWLLKPNDEFRMKESNIKVSVSMAYTQGEKIAKRMKSQLSQ